ncbi:MAG: sigma-70 family RNA polymerase sigma factor [Planctomycetota bacterium]
MTSEMQTGSMTILQSIAAGDSTAVQACIDQYAGLVWSLARRLCPKRADLDDAVQDVFVDLWKNAGRFNPELGSETTFVALLTRRRLIDRVRKDARRPNPSALIEDSVRAENDSIAESLETAELAGRVERVLEHLSDEQQRMIRLSLIQGLSHEKISASTGVPLGTVKTHIRRGLIKARDIVRQNDHPQDNKTNGRANSREVAR